MLGTAVYAALLPCLIVAMSPSWLQYSLLYCHGVGLGLFMLMRRSKSDSDMYSLRNVMFNVPLPPRTLWFNMGLWKDKSDSYPDACERLVNAVADAVKIGKGASVLDVGYGCGDSCFLLADRHQCQVTGVTNEDGQWRISRARHQQYHSELPVKLVHGSAIDIETLFQDQVFDHVTCIDAAYHFDTRLQFFQATHAKLAPGGTLGLFDLTFDTQGPWWCKWIVSLLGKLLDVPAANLVNDEVYKDQLASTGFKEVQLQGLTADEVFGGLSDWVRRQRDLADSWDVLTVHHDLFMRGSAWVFGLLARYGWVRPVIVCGRKER
ncbi:S-adenosyl-L-methionine-dependent methyltransferase [Syncephalastrum racemosum]|uniref:S-adenosyl-L-methionine-dependent methyltransferase n=1 Tax=Syncephalastrum racemosum TaxID=13706 RepID=A0A1X2H8G4_SYNRA|nr:S-adenosyl-L-methionine-dependent methyltransferase [Syncephalastrum racemosum]